MPHEMEQMSDIKDDEFFGAVSPPSPFEKDAISSLPKETAARHRRIYFQVVDSFQQICVELKKDGVADGLPLKESIENAIEALREDERMLMGLANAPYSYSARNVDNGNELFKAVVLHGVNVMVYSLKISLDIGVPDIRLPYIGMAAICYRVGALALPKQKLLAGPDDVGAMLEMDALVTESEKLLDRIKIPEFHMESVQYLMTLARENGEALRQTNLREAMYQYSIVIHMAHEFEKLTHQPAYGATLSPVDAMRKIRDEMDGYFNPEIIKLFFNHLSIYPLGSFVKLSSGETAKIIGVNEKSIIRPTVMIILDEEGREKPLPARINLRLKPNLYIKRAVVDPFLTERYIDLF